MYVIIDFETKKIEKRPVYPPEPVGAAIRVQGQKPFYMAWGHPSENNCTKAEATRKLKSLMRQYRPIYHHATFDILVGMVKLGLPMPDKFEDSLFLAFLNDPRDDSLALKELCYEHLGIKPTERDQLQRWILKNIPEAAKRPKQWGAYISEAPGGLVGKYAVGDVTRTEKLYLHMVKRVQAAGMMPAYEREKKLLPIVLAMENQGTFIDVKGLTKDLKVWERQHRELGKAIQRRLKLSKAAMEEMFGEKEFNLDSTEMLADAMEHAGKVTGWIKTAKGRRSTKRENLEKVCNDDTLLTMLTAHGILGTYMGTFAGPWLETAKIYGGLIFPSFNQVRSTDDGGKGRGTRTGRFSSSDPNLQNVPADPMEKYEASKRIRLSKIRMKLPKLRDYIIPPEGHVFIGRDYSQQEFRLFAHYENGDLMGKYLANPWIDVHDAVSDIIFEATGIRFPRKYVKTIGFGVLYGMGLEKLAIRLELAMEEARNLKGAYTSALPGIKDLSHELKMTARRDEPIRTWGGRLYYCEAPKMIEGRMWTFEYKLLNLLIQGGSADITKQAMIQVHDNCTARLAIQVHDELLAVARIGQEKKQMLKMREAMEDIKLDVPMLSEGKMSRKSWGAMTDWEPDKRANQ